MAIAASEAAGSNEDTGPVEGTSAAPPLPDELTHLVGWALEISNRITAPGALQAKHSSHRNQTGAVNTIWFCDEPYRARDAVRCEQCTVLR